MTRMMFSFVAALQVRHHGAPVQLRRVGSPDFDMMGDPV
jgi:hypothetical protein